MVTTVLKNGWIFPWPTVSHNQMVALNKELAQKWASKFQMMFHSSIRLHFFCVLPSASETLLLVFYSWLDVWKKFRCQVSCADCLSQCQTSSLLGRLQYLLFASGADFPSIEHLGISRGNIKFSDFFFTLKMVIHGSRLQIAIKNWHIICKHIAYTRPYE